jgi:hypothetical protein
MKIKIGLLGNMNNNNYSLLRYLRDANYDAELLVFNNDPKIFHPKNDSYDSKYFEYVRYLKWGSYTKYPFTSKKKIYKGIKNYNFLIGCRVSGSLFNKN